MKEKKKNETTKKISMKGGSCGPCNGADVVESLPAGQIGGKMKKLSKAIDNFLKKY